MRQIFLETYGWVGRSLHNYGQLSDASTTYISRAAVKNPRPCIFIANYFRAKQTWRAKPAFTRLRLHPLLTLIRAPTSAGFDNIARSWRKERRKGWRSSSTTANWANSLSRRRSFLLFLSHFLLSSGGFPVRPIVPSFSLVCPRTYLHTHIHTFSTHALATARGRFISYLLNFIKHSGRQRLYFPFSRLGGHGAEEASVVENGERG